jgi:hypothetical protein
VAKGRNRKSYRFASVTAEIGMESKAVLDTLSGAFAALVPRRNILLHEAAVTTAARRGTLCSRIGFSGHPGEVFHGSSLRPGSAIGALFCTATSKAGRGCARRLSDNLFAAGPQVRADMQQYLGKGGGPSRNRTGVQGFAVLCVTTPPSGRAIRSTRLRTEGAH